MTRRPGGTEAGFTLVELIVVAVLGALLVLATFQVLVTNQRTYTAHGARIQGSQALRGALDVLSAELREISPAGGDLVAMDDDTLQLRAMRAFGVVCHDSIRGSMGWRALRVGQWIAGADSVLVFADNDGGDASDDAWIVTRVSSSDTSSSCSGAPAQLLRFPNSAPFVADSVSSGAQVRAFTHVRYGLIPYDGEHYVGRQIPGGSWTPVVGPIRAGGLSFAYLDEDGVATTTATDVRQIRITVRTGSDVLDSTGQPVRDSVSTVVHTRN